MPYLEFGGHRYYYAGDLRRKGIPLLFCHGSGGRHHHWLYQIKGLKEKANPIAVDLPGHGRSEGAPCASVAGSRDWLHQFCRTAGLAQFVLAGHSLGGAIALDYAIKHPGEILGLVLVGSGGRLRVLPELLEELRAGRTPSILHENLYGPAASEELLEKGRKEMEETAAAVYYKDLCACDEFDVMEELPAISQPVLIICGSEDRLTPVKYSRYLEEKIPRGEVRVIEEAGHMVMLENPERVNQVIAEFMTQFTEGI